MGELRLLIQDSSGLLLHGELGEKLVNHYEFFAAFASDEEFRLVCDGKTLGSLPVSRPLVPEQRLIFAGRRWRVLEVDDDKIEFFELEVCASCQRRDSQISWREAIEEAVNALPGSATPGMVMAPADVIAEAAVAALQSNGFRVTPDVVER